MRNPKRIKVICRALERAWGKMPDQRLGQFLANHVFGHHTDIFFPEDDDIENMLLNIQP